MPDEFDEKAAELSSCECGPIAQINLNHNRRCSQRRAIAQALRDAKAEGTEAAIAWLENNWSNAELRMLDPINATRGMRHALIPTPAEKEYKSPDCICGVEDELDITY